MAWQKTYGGSNDDRADSIRQAADGGFIVAGTTSSSGAGGSDAWVLKLNADGTVAWQKTYGGSNDDRADSIQQTADGGYIVAGSTSSSGAGGSDAWILKLNADGTVAWQKTYGGSNDDRADSIQQTADGGYIVAGSTSSSGAGGSDAWVLKLNAGGTVAWQKTYGGSNDDRAESIQQTADGGFIVAGSTSSFGAGGSDAWVLKTDYNGGITGCAAVSIAASNSVPSATSAVPGYTDAVVAEGMGISAATDVPPVAVTAAAATNCSHTPSGSKWAKTYGGSCIEWANSIQQTADGGYVVAGTTCSFGAGQL